MVQREDVHEGPRTTSMAADDHMKWWDIIGVSSARETSDDKHICGQMYLSE